MAQVHNQLGSSRFINMCTANLLVHVYLFAQFPLFYSRFSDEEQAAPIVALSLICFSIGMILPGPFGAYLLERYKRKQLFLNSLIVFCAVSMAALHLPGIWQGLSPWLFGLEGAVYGLMQAAMGSTMVNDMLISAQRTKGDCFFGWAGRLGLPVGLVAGRWLIDMLPDDAVIWWSTVTLAVAYLLVAQTTVPVKAPVKMAVLTCDRFFLPSAWRTMLGLLPPAFLMGLAVGRFSGIWEYVAIAVGYGLAFVTQVFFGTMRLHFTRICTGYVLLTVSVALALTAATPTLPSLLTSMLLLGMGCALTSANLLTHFVECSEHCQRGTAQHTHLLVWSAAFALGFMAATGHLAWS